MLTGGVGKTKWYDSTYINMCEVEEWNDVENLLLGMNSEEVYILRRTRMSREEKK